MTCRVSYPIDSKHQQANREEFTLQGERTQENLQCCKSAQSSLCRNTNSAAGPFIITFPEAFFNKIATEPMKAFRINVRIATVIQTNGTLDLVPHQNLQ